MTSPRDMREPTLTEKVGAPWSTEKSHGKRATDAQILTDVLGHDVAIVGGPRATREARANLIAAAPEMFDALLAAEAELEQHTSVPGVTDHVLPAIRAAIAKARGQ